MSDWNRPTAIEGVTAGPASSALGVQGPAALVILLVSLIGIIAILSCMDIDDPRERALMPLELRGALCVWDRIRASMRNQTVVLAGPPVQIVAAPPHSLHEKVNDPNKNLITGPHVSRHTRSQL
jgi:hypothetical protein